MGKEGKWSRDDLMKKVFVSYLFISIMSTLAAMLGMLVDGIVIGQFLGQECVSAFGFASPVFILIAAIAGMFSNGGSSVCSSHIGRGENDKVRLNFTVTCLVSLIIGVAITVFCIAAAEPLAGFLGARGDLVPLTADYLRGIGAGGAFIMLSQVLLVYVRVDNDPILGFVSIIVMTAVNIVLDVLFGVVLKWGLIGMGLATSISYAAAFVVCLRHFFRKTNILKLARISGGASEIREVIMCGAPSALNRVCMTVRGIALNYLLLSIGGSVAVSALTVQNNINQFLSSVTMGVGMTIMLIASIFYGERDGAALRKTLRVSLKTGLTLSIIITVLVFIFAQQLVGLFLSGSPEAMTLAVRSFRMFCLSLPFSLFCVALLYFYQSTRNLFMANFICIVHGLAFVLAYAFGLSAAFGTDGVWISFLCAEVTAVASVFIVAGIRNKRLPKGAGDITLLPKDFEPAAERILDITIKNKMSDVMQVSERIGKFCERFTSDTDKINRVALCIEEMAGNVVQHAFRDGKKHYIDIKIIMEEKDIIFRLRDDGTAFNPLTAEVEDGQYGIAVVRKLAKELSYSSVAGMNNTMIKI